MRFPFVILPRAVYEDQRADASQLRRANAKLLRTIVRMKVAGGSIPLVRQGVVLPPRPADRIQAAIDASKYSNRPAVKAALRAFADRELEAGKMSPQQIEERIRNWYKIAKHDDEADDSIAIVVDDAGDGSDTNRVEVV